MTATYSSTQISGHHHRASSPSSSIASTSTLSTSPGTAPSSIAPTSYTSQMLPANGRSSIRLVNESDNGHDDSEDEYVDPVQAYARVLYEHTRQQMDNTITPHSEQRRSRNNSNENNSRQAGDRLSQHHYQQQERRAGSRSSGMA